jgi:hypothetical protein
MNLSCMTFVYIYYLVLSIVSSCHGPRYWPRDLAETSYPNSSIRRCPNGRRSTEPQTQVVNLARS